MLPQAVSRASNSLLQSTGQIQKSVDPEYEDQERRLRTLQTKLEKLVKDGKVLVEALSLLCAAQARTGEAVEAFYADIGAEGGSMVSLDGGSRPAGLKFAAASKTLDSELKPELERTLKPCLVEPLEAFQGLLEELESLCQKRGRKLLDFDAARSRARKQLEKEGLNEREAGEAVEGFIATAGNTAQGGTVTSPVASPPGSPVIPDSAGSGARSPASGLVSPIGPNSGKLSRTQSQLLQSYAAYAKWNSLLVSELPRIHTLRMAYVEPELEALVSFLDVFARRFEEELVVVSEGRGEGEWEGDLGEVVDEMRDLAICGGKL